MDPIQALMTGYVAGLLATDVGRQGSLLTDVGLEVDDNNYTNRILIGLGQHRLAVTITTTFPEDDEQAAQQD